MASKEIIQQALTLKVMHVITRITNGGSERRLLDALLVPAKHIVVTGEQHAGPNLDAVKQNAPVIALKKLRRELSPLKDISAVFALRSQILSESIDILHSHQSKAGLLSRLAVSLLPRDRRPRLIHSLSMASYGAGYGRLQSILFKSLEQLTHRWVDEYLVVGDDLANFYKEIGVPTKKFRRVRSSLNLQAFIEQSRLRAFSNRPIKLLFVGSLDERKGAVLLLDLIQTLREQTPVELLIAGVGPLSSQLQQQINDHDLPVKLLGFRRDIAALMSAADILLLPSFVEGLPQVLVQAVANRLPFISFDIHGARELIKLGGDGMVCKDNTPSAMVNAFYERINSEQAGSAPALPVTQWELANILEQIYQSYVDQPIA